MTHKEARSRLLEIAANLVRGEMSGLSPYKEDMPKKTPKKVILMIEHEGERQRLLGIALKRIYDALGEKNEG